MSLRNIRLILTSWTVIAVLAFAAPNPVRGEDEAPGLIAQALADPSVSFIIVKDYEPQTGDAEYSFYNMTAAVPNRFDFEKNPIMYLLRYESLRVVLLTENIYGMGTSKAVHLLGEEPVFRETRANGVTSRVTGPRVANDGSRYLALVRPYKAVESRASQAAAFLTQNGLPPCTIYLDGWGLYRLIPAGEQPGEHENALPEAVVADLKRLAMVFGEPIRSGQQVNFSETQKKELLEQLSTDIARNAVSELIAISSPAAKQQSAETAPAALGVCPSSIYRRGRCTP